MIGILGYSGFVGQNLIKFFQMNSIEFHCIDYRGNKKLPEVDILINLIGKAHDTQNISKDAEDYYNINTRISNEVFDAFITSNASKIIYISSVKAACDKIDKVLTEEYECAPKSEYGKSKRLAEIYIEKHKLPAGKYAYILRPALIYGTNVKGNLNSIIKFIKFGIPWPLGGFENKRSFCSIDNLNFVINELCQQNNIASGIYNVSDDEPISTNQLVNFISEALNRKILILTINKNVIYFFSKIGDFLNIPFNTENLIKLTESFKVSNHKIKHTLNKDLPVKIHYGIKQMAKNYN